MYVEDVALVTQHTSRVSVVLDDAAVADLFDRLIDAGRRPAEFARIWIHTHPGSSAEPSPTDEATFTRVFGECDWCVMCILAEGGATTARLRFSVGPGADLALAVTVDYTRPFAGTDQAAWDQEYEACVVPLDPWTDLTLPLVPVPEGPSPEDLWFPWGPEDPGTGTTCGSSIRRQTCRGQPWWPVLRSNGCESVRQPFIKPEQEVE